MFLRSTELDNFDYSAPFVCEFVYRCFDRFAAVESLFTLIH